ncbi:MAG: hypothetical protein G3M70_01330 [Candidatus Nitronauta litoralis]|uniref:Uncharacterized protein n=1 Tax=Candidatus Nitronauta litoralis TaxID=2705533 RepID=A0A7T0BTF8_9BACT|nr:MAG: hypothetical protein G3M70_01330 [Candidatus Nitronauta litoralis]
MSETESTEPAPEEKPKESPEKKPAPEPEPKSVKPPEVNESARLLEQRALELQSHLQSFGDELRSVSLNLEARKRETTVLKIMLYTGMVVLMVAFFYSSNALYKAQLESFQNNLNHLQNLTQANIDAMERSLKGDIGDLKKQMGKLEREQTTFYLKEQKLSEVLRTLDEAVIPLADKNPELVGQLENLKYNAEELSLAYQRQKQHWTGNENIPHGPGLLIKP